MTSKISIVLNTFLTGTLMVFAGSFAKAQSSIQTTQFLKVRLNSKDCSESLLNYTVCVQSLNAIGAFAKGGPIQISSTKTAMPFQGKALEFQGLPAGLRMVQSQDYVETIVSDLLLPDQNMKLPNLSESLVQNFNFMTSDELKWIDRAIDFLLKSYDPMLRSGEVDEDMMIALVMNVYKVTGEMYSNEKPTPSAQTLVITSPNQAKTNLPKSANQDDSLVGNMMERTATYFKNWWGRSPSIPEKNQVSLILSAGQDEYRHCGPEEIDGSGCWEQQPLPVSFKRRNLIGQIGFRYAYNNWLAFEFLYAKYGSVKVSGTFTEDRTYDPVNRKVLPDAQFVHADVHQKVRGYSMFYTPRFSLSRLGLNNLSVSPGVGALLFWSTTTFKGYWLDEKKTPLWGNPEGFQQNNKRWTAGFQLVLDYNLGPARVGLGTQDFVRVKTEDAPGGGEGRLKKLGLMYHFLRVEVPF